MDGYMNSSIEQQTIYEIYRACRLCGAGAGYKMPIIQNVVHLDSSEAELRQKIRECVQIEVHLEDKMPPLICELCVDKVNDFYEFLEMCRQTNKRTRLRLGLPPQTMPRGAPDAGDCILGVTEPVYLNEDSDESLLKPRERSVKGRFMKSKAKEVVRRTRARASSPPRLRANKRRCDDDQPLNTLQITSSRERVAAPRSILRKEELKLQAEPPSKTKRTRDTKDKQPTKKVKIVETKPSKPDPKPEYKCNTCGAQFSSRRSLYNHARIHIQKEKKVIKNLRCSKCQKAFPTKAVMDKHRCTAVSTYKCQNCGRCISNARNLSRHEKACYSKTGFKVSPKLLQQLHPVRVRLQVVDTLLQSIWTGTGYDVSSLPPNYGLSKHFTYPYRRQRIKSEPSYMVNIHDSIDDFDLNQDYVHWDSDSTYSGLDENDSRGVGTLATLSLKTIFSHKLLGKVPRKKRRVKASDSNFGSDNLGIDNIISSLSNDKRDDNDSLFGDDKPPVVSNDDFDSLFGGNDKKNNDGSDISKRDNEKAENKPDISNSLTDSIEARNVIESKSSAQISMHMETIISFQKNEDSTSEIGREDDEKVVLGNGTNDMLDKDKTMDKRDVDREENDENEGKIDHNVEDDLHNDQDAIEAQSDSGKCFTSVEMMKTDTTVVNDSNDNRNNYTQVNENVDSSINNDSQARESDTNIENNAIGSVIKNNHNNDIINEYNDTDDNDKMNTDSRAGDSIHTNIEIKTSTTGTDTEVSGEKMNNDAGDENNAQNNDSKVIKTGDTQINDNIASTNEVDISDMKEITMDDLDETSSSEIDDKSLMEALDEQIGERPDDKDKDSGDVE